MFTSVGIVARDADEAVEQALRAVLGVAADLGVAVRVDQNCCDAGAPRALLADPESTITDGCDLLVAIGGDGTLLRAAQYAIPSGVPLTGINLGRLGFLTDLSPSQIHTSLREILIGDLEREERFVLECRVMRAGLEIAASHALNDVVMQKWNSSRLITLDTYVDAHLVHSQRADGMIVATPTGSTAYAMSGGGPILHPALRAFALVPVCPHSLTNRPIVIRDTSVIEVHVGTEESGHAQVTCDGNILNVLEQDDQVHIQRHAHALHLIHPAGHDHFATLRAKLHWGRAPC